MEYCVASLDPGMGKRARSTAFSDGDGRSIRPHGGNRIEELRMAESVTAMDHLGIHGSMCIHESGAQHGRATCHRIQMLHGQQRARQSPAWCHEARASRWASSGRSSPNPSGP